MLGQGGKVPLRTRTGQEAWSREALSWHTAAQPLQESSSPNMAAGAAGTTTWCSGTCVTTKRGPSLFDGVVTSTRVPSPRECSRGAKSGPFFSPPWPIRKVAKVATLALPHAGSLQPGPWGTHSSPQQALWPLSMANHTCWVSSFSIYNARKRMSPPGLPQLAFLH